MYDKKEVNELLMMFIKDGYSQSGKVTKKTALKMFNFVSKDSDLQLHVNNGDNKSILAHEIEVK